MFKRITLLFLLVPFYFYACSPTNALTEIKINEPDYKIRGNERPTANPIELPESFMEAFKNGTRTKTGEPGENYWTQYAEYKLTAELSPSDTVLYGKAEITYHNNSPYQLPLIIFEVAQNLHKENAIRASVNEITGGMQINALKVEGKELQESDFPRQGEPSYGFQNTLMYVLLDQPLNPNSEVNFEIDYEFKIPQAGASERMGYADDNLFYLGYWYPQISVFDDIDGWFLDPFTGNAEFYHGFADYEISITAPNDWVVMSTGDFLNPKETLAPGILKKYEDALESDDITRIISQNDFGNATIKSDDGLLTWQFKADNIMDVAFSATTESIWDATRAKTGVDDNGNSTYTQINTFWRPTAEKWVNSADYARHVIEFLSKYTNLAYPWPHMTAVEGEGIIGGGMEYPMITLAGAYNNMPETALYEVIAHEIAHMWLPMLVSNNERRHAWMDEGATSFHEAIARWDYFNMNENLMQEYAPILQLSGSEEEGELMRYSDYHYDEMSYYLATYPKPASLLFALRGILGEDVFKEAWQSYIARWAYKHPTPYDFFNTFNDISGQDLSWFWRSWYFETWILDQAIESVTEKENEVEIVVKDLGNVPMPVDLTIEFKDGTSIEKRIGVEHWLSGTRNMELNFSTNSEVMGVYIDKRGLFPDVDSDNNQWIKK